MTRHRKLVVDELIAKPSAVSPTLFVGLGGCGCRMVTRVAQHLRGRVDYADRYRGLVKFALVDTNVNDLEARREVADETFLISDFEKEQYSNLASGKMFLEADSYFTQWVPPNYRFRAGDTAGAGQIRIESRLGAFYQMKHKDFVPRFRKLLEALKSHEHGHRRLDSSEIRIVLCFSIAGGTGSGCHLPIAYMLRDQTRELGNPTVIGIAVLPAVFEDKTGINKDGTFANSYAALKEVEHMMKLGAPESRLYPEEGIVFHYDPSDTSKRVVRDRPFEFLYVVDKPESFSVSEPVDAAADGLYLQLFSPLYREQAADYDNYTQHQRFLVPHDFEGKGILGFTSFYGSYGSAVLLVPVPGLVDYCSRAAALSLLRASFLGSIPGDPVYGMLRSNPDLFVEVTLHDEKNERPVHESEFHKKTPADRDALRDRLFLKRVRLLAFSELSERREDGRFLAVFRHGQKPGEIPTLAGGYELRADRVRADEERLASHGLRDSIASIVLPAAEAAQPGQPPGLLVAARQKIEAYLQENPNAAGGDVKAGELKNRAAVWAGEYRRLGLQVLNQGYAVGTVRYPGLDALIDLQFLKDGAGEVDLTAKRYAILSLRERIKGQTRPVELAPDFDLGDRKDGDTIKERDALAIIQSLEQQAIDQAMARIQKAFLEKLSRFRENLDKYAATLRRLEEGFGELEREHGLRLARLREQGDDSANQYVLDAEALQIEDGRRMWDFYYEDKIAELPELSLGDRRVQQLLGDEVTNLSLAGNAGTSATLDRLFTALTGHARRELAVRIGGDPHAADRERREGLTLSEALELEVVYRALYLSHPSEIRSEGDKAVRRIIAEYRALPQDSEGRVRLDAPIHMDYLRDKIKRVVNEKASLLCVYDESRDRHGGVRPDHVFLAAIDEDFKNGTIERALKGADANLTWVTSGWHNPKEIIFYRAVLNVPLYVFGRMAEMKNFYYAFKRQSKRSKVLHTDRNWEETLPDLDPDSAQEDHRQTLVRNQIINFAALLTIRNPHRPGQSHILRRDGRYFLCDPGDAEPAEEEDGAGDGLACLGATMAEAIERLPEVLTAERVKYLPYQQLLHAVREGLAPDVLRQVVNLPFRWRRNRDDLRNQYGSHPSLEQSERLKDYTESYRRLHESLEKLLERLRHKQIEQQTLGEDAGANGAHIPREEARANLEQSIRILATFNETWRQMEDPSAAPGLIPGSFRELFKPLSEERLNETLEDLRTAFGASH